MFTWIPTYLKTERDLTVVGTSGYLFVVIAGAFLGYLTAGFVHDLIGAAQGVRAVRGCWRAPRWSRTSRCRPGSNTTLLIVGFPLGFFASGCFSGFGSYLAELFPTHARATGGGFCYNVGRGIGALFPGIIGFLAAAVGLGGAIAFGVFGYVLAIAALLSCRRPRVATSHDRRAAQRSGLRPRAAPLRRHPDPPGARAGRVADAAPPARARRGGVPHGRVRAARAWPSTPAPTSTRSATRPTTGSCTAASRPPRRCRRPRASPRSASTPSRRSSAAACCSTWRPAPPWAWTELEACDVELRAGRRGPGPARLGRPVRRPGRLPGGGRRDRRGSRWLAERKPFAVGADNVAWDAIDASDPELGSIPGHTILIVQSGIHIIESLYLEELAKDGVREFGFVCLPLKLRGGTGSPVRPIALV